MAKKVKAAKKKVAKISGTKTVFLKLAYDYYHGRQVKVANSNKAKSRTTTIVEDGKQVSNKTETVKPEAFYTACSEFSTAWGKITGQSLPQDREVEVTITWKEL